MNTDALQSWIDRKFAEIANQLPESVKQPASFRCGHDMGYKQALLDLEKFLDIDVTEDDTA
jgi:hypothetical protein